MAHGHQPWMQRCLQLARLGAAGAAPNPMVGAVLVYENKVLAEGWHKRAGDLHAEADLLRRLGNEPVPSDAVLYVNLEPCSHHGRTPPCADAIIERGVRNVVIAHTDPFPEVSGRGIDRLRSAGVQVSIGVDEAQARWLNRRFLTSIEKARPYVVLKWAQSADGFLDRSPRTDRSVQRISDPITDVLVHRWRSEEQAILVGSRTVINDDPRLDVRHLEGRSPLRVVLDRHGRTPASSKVFNGEVPILLFTSELRDDAAVEQHIIPPDQEPLPILLQELHKRSVRSVLVEGGTELLTHFIEEGSWDEARVIHSPIRFGAGTRAPSLAVAPIRSASSGVDRIDFHTNGATPDPGWEW